MQEIEIRDIARRSVRGVFALTSRTFVLQVIALITSFILTIFLDPATFGVFFVVSAAIAFLSYFSDIGLAAALIQKKESVSSKELKVTFTVQQILVISLVIVALFASGFVGKFYSLDREGVLLFQALVFSFFLSSLKTIPSIILERDLRFEKLVIPQIVETLFFSIVVVSLAISGFGILSFTYAVLARGFSGLIAIYIISPWMPSIAFSKEVLKKLLSFGIPFQANSVLALIKDDLLIVYLGRVLPLSEVGFIGFAQKWALMPLRLVMDNIIRITFPSFSRLQSRKDVLRVAVEKSIFASTFFVFPALTGLIILSPYLLQIIPKYLKWEPAMLSLFFFALNAIFSSVSTPLTNLLNAIGKIKITLYLMIFWTVATWILTPLAVFRIGFNAVAVVSALISLSAILVIFIVRRYVKFSLTPAITPPILGSAVMGVVLYFVSPLIVHDLPGFLLTVTIGVIIYFLVLNLIARKQVLEDIRIIRSLLLNK